MPTTVHPSIILAASLLAALGLSLLCDTIAPEAILLLFFLTIVALYIWRDTFLSGFPFRLSRGVKASVLLPLFTLCTLQLHTVAILWNLGKVLVSLLWQILLLPLGPIIRWL